MTLEGEAGAPRKILDTIGNTSLVPLRNVVPKNGARLFASSLSSKVRIQRAA